MATNAKIKNVAVKITADAERQIKSGHPWVFERSLEEVKKPLSVGDLAIVFGRKQNKFMAVGLADPEQLIRIRILHQGKSRPIDKEFFQHRLEQAYSKRKPLLTQGVEAYRLVYGENDGLPGLILDVYGNYLVIKLYSAAWGPWLSLVIDSLPNILRPKEIIVRLSRKTSESTAHSLVNGQRYFNSTFDGQIKFREYGVVFKTNLIKGHKTGFFLDHRQNRLEVQKLAAGKKVLDLFCYTGAFSMHALAGGAESVTAVDISSHALEAARRNYDLNGFDTSFETICSDVFDVLREHQSLTKYYDLIIVDPPAFAKKQSEIEKATKAYMRLFSIAMALSSPGGIILLASCSSRIDRQHFDKLVRECIIASSAKWTILKKTNHDLDHPQGINELHYLKSSFLRRLT